MGRQSRPVPMRRRSRVHRRDQPCRAAAQHRRGDLTMYVAVKDGETAISHPLDPSRMVAERRISSTFKDVPGGQVLGPTFDYTHRLLDFTLMANGERPDAPTAPVDAAQALPRVGDILEREGMLEPPPSAESGAPAQDITRTPLVLPASRPVRLQNLARGDEGFLLALAYSTQRGYGNNHPFVGEIRFGAVSVSFVPEELGFAIEIGEIDVTECDMVNQFAGSHDVPPQFTRGYGLAFGHAERKAMAMALVDRPLRAQGLSAAATPPAQDEEFELTHSAHLEALGVVQHAK